MPCLLQVGVHGVIGIVALTAGQASQRHLQLIKLAVGRAASLEATRSNQHYRWHFVGGDAIFQRCSSCCPPASSHIMPWLLQVGLQEARGYSSTYCKSSKSAACGADLLFLQYVLLYHMQLTKLEGARLASLESINSQLIDCKSAALPPSSSTSCTWRVMPCAPHLPDLHHMLLHLLSPEYPPASRHGMLPRAQQNLTDKLPKQCCIRHHQHHTVRDLQHTVCCMPQQARHAVCWRSLAV